MRKDPLAIAWLTAKRKVRTAWLDEWIRADPTHTLDYAKRAQQMLLMADLFSLWLCCDCPVDGDQAKHTWPIGDEAANGHAAAASFDFAVRDFMAGRIGRGTTALTGLAWTVAVDPYPVLDVAAVAVGQGDRGAGRRLRELAGIDGRQLAGRTAIGSWFRSAEIGRIGVADVTDLVGPAANRDNPGR